MTTNTDVAVALADNKSCPNLGGNMHTQRVPDLIAPQDFIIETVGYSYTTAVAMRVKNLLTSELELWLTPDHYSHTTLGHKGRYLNVFLSRVGGRVYHTYAVNHHQHRNAWLADYNHAMGFVSGTIKACLRSGIHQKTRQRQLTEAMGRLENAIHLLTENTTSRQPDEVSNCFSLIETLGEMHRIGENDRALQRVALQGLAALEYSAD